MKFFHVGDLHFGKTLHNVSLVEADQPYWVEQFIKKVDEYEPDAIVIAGDVYDRRIPSAEAMKLFDHLLTELSKREKYVFIVPGNHDSAIQKAGMKPDQLCVIPVGIIEIGRNISLVDHFIGRVHFTGRSDIMRSDI